MFGWRAVLAINLVVVYEFSESDCIIYLTQVIREGTDITLVGWGAQLAIMEQACVDAEKVDILFPQTWF